MTAPPKLKDEYILAQCCRAEVEDGIVGYYSHDNVLKVHKSGCSSLAKVDRARLVALEWREIVAPTAFEPGDDFALLDVTDFAILDHHDRLGIDYSLKVARDVQVTKAEAFKRHRRLRDLGLVARVDATMVQYRRNVTDHKWIKHRNHTYYDLTDRGRAYLNHYRGRDSGGG